MPGVPDLERVITRIMRDDRGRLMAALVSSLGSFDLAEDGLSEALASALVHWARTGLPSSPQGWLLRVARRKAIDQIRKDTRLQNRRGEMERLAEEDQAAALAAPEDIPDERLRLIFTCCHPALDEKSRVALTLRCLGGLTTGEVARAFLDKEATMGQRLSRARAKIVAAGVPFAVPGPELWDARLNSVLAVLYLIFNAGHVAGTGPQPLRSDLCEEAIFLARMLDALTPEEPEVQGLLALMLTCHARRAARQGAGGTTIALDKQDRGKWDRAMIAEGLDLLERAMSAAQRGPYQLKAAISALHVSAPDAEGTDWRQIVLLYGALLTFEPTAVVRLNCAVALAQAGEPDRALEVTDALAEELDRYQPFHAARAKLLADAGYRAQAETAYARAIALTGNAPDRAYLQKQKRHLLP